MPLVAMSTMISILRYVGLFVGSYLLPLILNGAGIPIDEFGLSIGRKLGIFMTGDQLLHWLGLFLAILLITADVWWHWVGRLLSLTKVRSANVDDAGTVFTGYGSQKKTRDKPRARSFSGILEKHRILTSVAVIVFLGSIGYVLAPSKVVNDELTIDKKLDAAKVPASEAAKAVRRPAKAPINVRELVALRDMLELKLLADDYVDAPVREAPVGTYFLVGGAHLGASRTQDSFATVLGQRPSAVTGYEHLRFEIHRLQNGSTYLVGFVNKGEADDIDAIDGDTKYRITLQATYTDSRSILKSIPADRILLGWRTRQVPINQVTDNMYVLDMTIR